MATLFRSSSHRYLPPAFLPWEAIDGGARVMVQTIDLCVSLERLGRTVTLAGWIDCCRARVAALLGNGRGVTESAIALGVSLNTAEAQATCSPKPGPTPPPRSRSVASIPVELIAIHKYL
jgi:hypothetical protein